MKDANKSTMTNKTRNLYGYGGAFLVLLAVAFLVVPVALYDSWIGIIPFAILLVSGGLSIYKATEP